MTTMTSADSPFSMSGPQAAGVRAAPQSRRVEALDAVRGFALLGIFIVNIGFFAGPMGLAFAPLPPADSATIDVAAHAISKTFFEAKFYPLFSMLFGMGLILQMRSIEGAGLRFAPLYLRRLAVLALFGLAHVFFFWYGDILVIYAVVGLILLLMRRARPRTMLITAAVVLFISGVLSFGYHMLAVLAAPPEATPKIAQAEPGLADSEAGGDAITAPADTPAADQPETSTPPTDETLPRTETAEAAPSAPREPPASPLARLFHNFAAGKATGPDSEGWMEPETAAFRDGPFREALLFRLFTYGTYLVVAVLTFGWHIVAMFLIGAALVKLDIFTPQRRPLLGRIAIIGLGVGLPLSVLVALAPYFLDLKVALPLTGALFALVSTMVPLGYFAGGYLLATSPAASAIARPFAAAGRMALSNYLLQTFIATFLMYHWGLQLFGTFSRAEQFGLVLAVFAGQLVLSMLWLRWFQFGPMEWLWRTLTYMRAQPLLRHGSDG